MMRYRKKPVVIEAFQWFGKGTKCPGWFHKARAENVVGYNCDMGGILFINTLEGQLTVSKNDWIIQGVKGEIYPCKPDIFEQTYEPANAPATNRKE